MTHEEIKILISAYIDGEVTPSEKTIVEEHLSSCPSCQKDYKTYMAMSSSLSKWSDEALSPDEEINVQKRLEQRREPMFTKRTVMTLGTTLALTIIVGSVVQMNINKGVPGRLKAASDIGDQYSTRAQYQPAYLASVYTAPSLAVNRGFDGGLASSANIVDARTQMAAYQPSYTKNVYPLNGGFAAAALMQRAGQEATNYYQNSDNYYDANEEERKKVQRADISLLVDNAFKVKSQLADLILEYNGIIESSEFSRSSDGAGQGTMVCKVYPKDLEHALQQIRKLGEVEAENESSMDVTDQYKDAQKNIDEYSSDEDRLQKKLNGFRLFNPTTDEEKDNIQRQIEQTREEIKGLEGVINFYKKQTSMSLIVINFHDTFKNTVRDNDSGNTWKTMFENKWKTTMDDSLEVISSILFGSVYLFSYIVPALIWALIFGVIYFIVRMFFKK